MRATIGEVVATHGATSGFDYLRIGLAVAVVGVHSLRITTGPDALEAVSVPMAALINLILPLFFGLSGFLVAGSLERVRDLRVFLAFRALRIFPALIEWEDRRPHVLAFLRDAAGAQAADEAVVYAEWAAGQDVDPARAVRTLRADLEDWLTAEELAALDRAYVGAA